MSTRSPFLRRLSLRWQFVIPTAAVALLISAFFYVFIPARIEQQGTQALHAKSRVVTTMTAANLLPAMVFSDSIQVATELRTALLSPDVVYAVVCDQTGAVAGSVGMAAAEKFDYRHTPLDGRLADHEKLWQTQNAIIHKDEVIGALYMGFSLESIRQESNRVRRETGLVTIGVLLVQLMLVIWVSGFVTSHLEKMVEAARSVMAGKHAVRAPVGPADEVGALAEAFNAMLDRLTAAQRELSEVNRDLEDRVATRTGELETEVIEHRRTEESLRISEERQRQIIDLVPNLIFVKDANGRFLMVNAAFAEFYGQPVEDIQGSNEADLGLPEEEFERYRKEDLEILQSGLPRFVPSKSAIASDGSVRILHSLKIPFTFSRTTSRCVLCVTTDVTAIKRAEEELKRSLREKDVLLKEVHHRVKNNLQVINSLLSLQAQEFADPVLREALVESQNRIRSMAMVHEQLYSAGDLAGIDFGEYISRLAAQLMRLTDRSGITYHVESEHVSIGIDVAVPCGLIVNELISNALKHAFHGKQKGTVRIALRQADASTAELVVSDDGVGLPPALDPETVETMGLTLVTSLTRQIHGTLALERSGGTTFSIRFGVT
jgi:PAS domain S-box-containing protein